jgi:dUTP pyrophosphatase
MSDYQAGACEVRFVLLSGSARPPARATGGSAGWDLVAAQDATIKSGSHSVVGTGVAVEIDAGLVGLVCPRSGLAWNYGVTVLNGPGVVDSDYRGEVKVILFNAGDRPFQVSTGDRIAQLVVLPLPTAQMIEVQALTETQRGDSGLGSSG